MHNVDIRNVSLGQIQYFVKVAEYNNITKAAEYFNLTQSTLSKKLKSLEIQLDLQLFIRGSKSIKLTPAGKYLAERWKNMSSLLEEEVQYAHILQRGQTHRLVVASMDSFRPEAFLLPITELFTEAYPDICIRMESDSAQDIRKMLIHNEADVIFSILYDVEDKDWDQMEYLVLGETEHCACMKRTNPLAKKDRLKIQELRQSDFICISPQYLPEYQQMLQKLCREKGFLPNITNYVSSAHSLTLNIQSDQDIFVCDKYYADLNEESHCRIPIEDTTSAVVMVWRKDQKNPFLKKYVEVAKNYFKKKNCQDQKE